MTTASPATSKPRRRFEIGWQLLRRPLGLPLWEAMFVLVASAGLVVDICLPLFQRLRQIVR